MEKLKDYTIKELTKELKNRDIFHDKIADATNGNNNIYTINGVCDYCLELNNTGGTVVRLDDINFTIYEFIYYLENKLK